MNTYALRLRLADVFDRKATRALASGDLVSASSSWRLAACHAMAAHDCASNAVRHMVAILGTEAYRVLGVPQRAVDSVSALARAVELEQRAKRTEELV